MQRSRTAEIAARKGAARPRPGEVMTACQQACPTNAIQFARLDHEQTLAVQWRGQPRHYAVLSQLGTRPRTVYLAKIWNLNPDLPVQLGPEPGATDRPLEDGAKEDR